VQSISEMIQPIKWHSEQLHLLDQRLLPLQQVWLGFDYPEDVSNAIREMVVRGRACYRRNSRLCGGVSCSRGME